MISMSVAMALFIGNDALVKLVSADLPALQLIFLRGLFASVLMLCICTLLGTFRPAPATPENPRASLPIRQLLNPRLLLRALLDAVASLTYLLALFHMPLGNATAINMATPLVITLMAMLFFHEQVGATRWLAIALGFTGVLLIVQPAADGFNFWALACLAATALHAGRDLLTRLIPRSIPSLLITLSTVLAVSLLSGLLSVFQGWKTPTGQHLLLLGAASVLLSAGYFLLIGAMRAGEMSLIAPFRYTGLLFALVLGWWLWGEVPNTLAFGGIALLVGAGLYMLTTQRPAAPASSANALDAASD